MAVQSGVYRGRTAAERAEERRERLLAAALAVWADPGRRTTMTAVCAEAGLTERYFYESFTDLDAALTAVLEAVAAEIEQATLAAVDGAGHDPVARVRAALEALVTLLADDPRKGRVAIVESATVPHLRARRTQLIRHFAQLASESAHEIFGSAPDERRDQLAGLLFVGGLVELVTAWLEGVVEATPEEVVESASRGFLGLYG